MTSIALFGANGTIGLRILREALSRGHRVTAVVRDPAKLAGEDHERLTVTTGDVRDPGSVAVVASGHEVLVSAIGGGYEDGAAHAALVRGATEALVDGLRSLGADAPRLVAVGGAGSLRKPDGTQVWDAEGLPELVLQVMHGHGESLAHYRTVTDVDWTNISPAATIEPGERTGSYRTGLDELVVDANGESRISAEDYALALLDEIEQPRHRGKRFTVGY